MAKEFTDILDSYLKARTEYLNELSLGDKSKYWDDTYGFGNSRVLKDYVYYSKELNNFVRLASLGFI